MTINLTETAARRARDHLARHAGALGLRLGVRQSGCSGWSYTVDFAEAIDAGDVVLEVAGVKLIVATECLGALDGIEIDYVREGLSEKFAFRNPNAASSCGCGESFSLQ
ncbi:MAG: iron-sulfur cluster assembly accessory protein [Gammaproteobacteria bacterium]|nr:iron-sulfur cluster assembly accessory protein [Gammaproteobacteria bacterium]